MRRCSSSDDDDDGSRVVVVAFLSLSSAMRSRCRISDRESGRVNIPPEEEVEVVAAAKAEAEVAAAASTGRMGEIGIIDVDAMNNTAERRSCSNDDGIVMILFEAVGAMLDVDYRCRRRRRRVGCDLVVVGVGIVGVGGIIPAA